MDIGIRINQLIEKTKENNSKESKIFHEALNKTEGRFHVAVVPDYKVPTEKINVIDKLLKQLKDTNENTNT